MHDECLPLAIRGVTQAGEDIFFGERGKVSQDLLVTHSRRKVREHIIDRDPQPANARLATPLARLDSDKVRVVHTPSLPARWQAVNKR